MKSTRSRNAGELHYLTNLTPLQKHSKKQFVWSFRIVVSLLNQILTCKKSGSQLFESLLSIPSWKTGQKVMTWSWQSHDWIWMQLNTATSKWTTSSTMLSRTVSVAAVTIFAPQVPAQSKSTRTGNTDALSDSGMLAWCTWPLPGSILSPLSKILQIPRSTSLYFWHLNPAHNCLNRYCQCQAEKKGQKVMTWSWQSHDWIWMQLNTATSKWTTSSTMLSRTVSVAAVTIFAPQVPAQSKSTRTGNTDALSDSGMLAWCTWPLPGSILSPLSKILQIPRSTSLHSWHLNPAHNCLNRYCQCQAEKKGQKVMTWSWQSHDWIWMQLNTATSKWTTSSTMLSRTVSVAAVTIFAPQVPAQSKSTRTGNTDALSDSGMLAWCTWPLPGSILSPLSKILQIPRSTSLYFWHLNPAHNCLNRYCQCQAEKKVRRSWHGHDTVMTESECNWI